MSIVVIGDRKTGKTSIVRALAENGKNIKVNAGTSLAQDLYNPETKEIAGTDQVTTRTLSMEVNLPSTHARQMKILWVDTPGEFWSNPQTRGDFPSAWQSMEDEIKRSKAIILILPPHQGMVFESSIGLAKSHLQPVNPLPNTDQWVNRLQNWLEFLEQNCQRVKHIIIALHKADLFCDIEQEGTEWRYQKPNNRSPTPWYKYSDHVIGAYFGAGSQLIRQYKGTEIGSRTNFFITTTENQDLLELPWLYLAPYLIHI